MAKIDGWRRTLIGWLVLATVLISFRFLLNWLLVFHTAATVIGLAVAVVLTTAIVVAARRRRRRRMTRGVESAGWNPLAPNDREWPWDALRQQGASVVEHAWTRRVDGLPVVAALVRFSGNAFAGAVRERAGWAIFVVVDLPQAAPPMAMRLPAQYVGDSPKLARSELRWAALHDEIPPWTVRGEELFTVEFVAAELFTGGAKRQLITPETIGEAVRRALRVTDLLELGSPTPAQDGPAGAVPTTDSADQAAELDALGLDAARLRAFGLDATRLKALGLDTDPVDRPGG